LAALLTSPPSGVDPYVLVTIRADSMDGLLGRIGSLGLDPPRSLNLLPMAQAAYRDVISSPSPSS